MADIERGTCDWRLAPDDRAVTKALASALDVSPAVARVLMLRGATTAEAARRFLNPHAGLVSDPFLLTDMQRAVDRIAAARDDGETVLVFGDYDVDGISGTASLVRGLKRYGMKQCFYGIPERLVEGYGLSAGHVDRAHEKGVSLIITVDNGIGARDALARAHTLGIDVIVTDHHLIEHDIPDAYAVINPKREPESHPAIDLCGSGVVLKLVHALTGEMADLDLAALGTIADVVPLTGENRAIVALGLRDAATSKRPGLRELMAVSNVPPGDLRSDAVAYQIAPRINAGGRMADGLTGLELLLTESSQEAHALAEKLDAANEARKAIEAEMLAEALAMLDQCVIADHRCIVLANRGWHRGVIGILASRLQSTHYCPVVLIALDAGGIGHGSARSIAGFNIAAAIERCKEHLVSSGGHAMAAGLTIHEPNLAAFQAAFAAEAKSALPAGELRRILEIDAQVSLTEIDARLVRTLDRLQPFGQGNRAPVFCTYGIRAAVDSWRELRGGHLKATVKDGPKLIDVIGFRMANRLPSLTNAPAIDIAFTPQLNTWRGETSVQLVLKDVRAAASA